MRHTATGIVLAGLLLLATAASAEPPADGKTMGETLGAAIDRMMDDPALKEMMRLHQGAMVSRMYGPLYRELGLTGEVQQKLVDLLTARSMVGFDDAASFLSDGKAPRAEDAGTIGDERERIDAQIRALLGEERFTRYEAYEKTIPARMRLDQFRTQMAGGDQALRDWQVEALVQVMREEEKGASPWQEESRQRVLERARQILSAEQWKAFGEFQKQELLALRLGMKVSRDFFGDRFGGAGTAGSPPGHVDHDEALH